VSIKTSDLKVGDILHDIHRERAGNTTMNVEGHWLVVVKAVAEDGSWYEASWNGNKPSRHYGSRCGYTRHPKEWYRPDIMGGRKCAVCYAREDDGHKPTCSHPRAIAARKRAAKTAP
jgi:hypothetical protein